MLERRFIIFAVFVTFSLILLGGFVHNTESSLACKDWPWCNDLCKGKSVEDLSESQKEVELERRHAIEIGHRILASFVGMLTVTIFLLVLTRKRFDSRILWFSFAAVILVLFQGLLGALTVKLKLPTYVSTAHMGVAELFFTLMISLSFFTKPSNVIEIPAEYQPKLRSLSKLLGFVIVLIYSQILLGAYMRHSGGGLAAGYGAKAAIFGLDTTTGEYAVWPTLTAAKWNVLHRYMAALVVLFVFIASTKLYVYGKKLQIPAFRWYAMLASASIVVQATLGIMAIWHLLDVMIVTAHLGVGTFCYAIMLGAGLHVKSICSPWDYSKKPSKTIGGEIA